MKFDKVDVIYRIVPLCTKKDGLENSIFTRQEKHKKQVKKTGETMRISFSEWITEQ